MTPKERKAQSENILKALDLPINETLPLIESEGVAQLRSPAEVACRVIALVSVAAAASGVEKQTIVNFLKAEVLWDSVSPEEQQFLETENSSEEEMDSFAWRTEAAWLLLWSVGFVDDLALPTTECDADDLIAKVPCTGESTDAFVEAASLRPIPEILNASDLIYRAHWASRHLEEQGSDCVLDPDVALEWHTAVNWLTVYDEAEWDDVLTDT